VGKVGIYVAEQLREVDFTPLGAVGEGWRQMTGGVRLVLVTVRGLALGQVSPKELGGPIVIGQLSGRMARAGIIPFLNFMAFISINLAVFNLPHPRAGRGHLRSLRSAEWPVPVTWRSASPVGMVFPRRSHCSANDVLRLLAVLARGRMADGR
jgi:hypothetical protein